MQFAPLRPDRGLRFRRFACRRRHHAPAPGDEAEAHRTRLDLLRGLDPGRDDRDPDFAGQRVVESRAEDDVGFGIDLFSDAGRRFVDLEQLCLSPQCGFASTAEGNRLTSDDQRRKLELVSAVARVVWPAEDDREELVRRSRPGGR